MSVRIAVISHFFLYKALDGNGSLEKIAQIPTDNKLFSEKHKNTGGVIPSFKMCLAHTHTLNTGLVQIWFPTKHWEI